MGQSGIECGKIISWQTGRTEWNPLDFSLLSTSPEFLMDQNKFLLDLTFHNFSRSILWHEVNNFESSVVIQELEFAINRAL